MDVDDKASAGEGRLSNTSSYDGGFEEVADRLLPVEPVLR